MATKKATKSARKSSAKKTQIKKTVAAKVVRADITPIDEQPGLPKPSALVAELVGTFVLTGAFIALFTSGVIGVVGIALVLIALVIMFGVISRAHFNPAITIAMWANRKIGGLKTLLYIAMQVVGAALAFLAFKAVFAAANGVDIFAGSEAAIIDNLINKQGVTEEMIAEAGGLLQFATANGFATLTELAERIGVPMFVENNISGAGLAAFFAELVGAIIFGLGAGVAYLKAHKPMVKALALGFGLFAGIVISGSTVILNPAIAGALGSFAHGWGFGGAELNVADIMWPIVTYIVGTIAGVVIGFTGYRFLLKDSGYEPDQCEC